MNGRLRGISARFERWLLAAATCVVTACGPFSQLFKVVSEGDSRELRVRLAGQAAHSSAGAPLLILALDGMGRDLLYSMLEHGDLPELGALLGREGAAFPHAYFVPNLTTTLPSTTGAVWASMFTGATPAQNGFTGNEFFVREKRQFAAPIPVSVHASAQSLSVFTEGYANQFLCSPTIYEVMRKREPTIDIWVSMSQFYDGADRLLMTRRSVLGTALEAFLSGHTEKNLPRAVWADLDKEDIEVVVERLGREQIPDVLTVYLFGTDNWAHIAPEGPDRARRSYMMEVVDPAIGTLRKRLVASNAWRDRYVVVTGDHGHTEVIKDEAHALSIAADSDPPAVLSKAGYRVRPFEGEVKDSDAFQSVLAYQGAMAYVYLADRSTCRDGTAPCDWTRPPRYTEDVLPVADAFYRNNLDGSLVPGMKGTLDLIFTRRPVPVPQVDRPFEVYVGDGNTEPLDAYLRNKPRPTYVAFDSRLRELASGPHGERAGDVLLLAHNGDRENPEERYYFATPYHSWHGSPSRQDSLIPLIVARPEKTTTELDEIVQSYLGRSEDGFFHAEGVGALLVGLRGGRTSQIRPLPPRR